MMARHCSHCFSNGAIYLQKMYKVRKFEGFEGFERFEKFERLLPSVRASRARSERFEVFRRGRRVSMGCILCYDRSNWLRKGRITLSRCKDIEKKITVQEQKNCEKIWKFLTR